MVNVHALMMWRCRGWAGVGMWTLCDRLRGPSWYLDQTEGEMDEQTEGEMWTEDARSVWTVVVYRLRTGCGGL